METEQARLLQEIEEIKENPYRFISERAQDASAKYGVKSVSIRARRN